MDARGDDDADHGRPLPSRGREGQKGSRPVVLLPRKLVRLARPQPGTGRAGALRQRLFRRRSARHRGKAALHRESGRDGSVPEPHLPLALEPQVRHRQLFAGGPLLRHGGGPALLVRGGEEARHPRDPRRRVFPHGGGQLLLQQIRHLRRADGRLPRRKEPLPRLVPLPPVAKGLRLLVGLYDAAQRQRNGQELPRLHQRRGRRGRALDQGRYLWLAAGRGRRIADALFARTAPPREAHRRRSRPCWARSGRTPPTRSPTARRAATARATRSTA